MTDSRYATVYHQALAAMNLLDRYGSTRMNNLAKVTVTEAGWLQANNPHILPYTRIFDYEDDDYKEDCHRPQRSKRPIIREIWVGQRSLSSLGEESDLPEGMSASTMEQEDSAELSELQTMLYNDEKGFNLWLLKKSKQTAAQRGCTMAQIRQRLPKNKYGVPVYAMFTDPETGEYRPIMNGDCIQIAWGSNERFKDTIRSAVPDLDALFMEEPSDPRSESDPLMRELTRDQVRANNSMEEEFLTEPPMTFWGRRDGTLSRNSPPLGRRQNGYSLPAENLPEGIGSKLDDLQRWRVAHAMVERYLESPDCKHTLDDYRELADAAFDGLKSRERRIKFNDEGKLVEGQFVNRKDYWDEVEHNLRGLEKPIRRAAPKAMPPDVFTRTPNPALTQPSTRPVLKPGQKWLRIGADGSTKDISGLAAKG